MKTTKRASGAGLLNVLTAYCLLPTAFISFTAYCIVPSAYSQEFDRIVIDSNFAGAYQVEVADVNGDKKPDIVAVGGSTCAWYENPTWNKRIVTGPKETPGIISSATADLDGDGKAEIAIAYEFAMNTPKKGKLLLAGQGRGLDDPWTLKTLSDIGSIHRLRWGDPDGRDGLDLIIAPLFGADAKPPTYQQSAAILRYPANRKAPRGERIIEKVSSRLVLHAIDVIDVTGDGRPDILTADNDGVQLISYKTDDAAHADPAWLSVPLVAGAPGEAPRRGCSEVHLGRASGSRFIATIEPWHGTQVVVWTENAPNSLLFGPRAVIDDTLADGHALWVADVDGDGDQEILAGHRGKDHRVSMYDFDRADQRWKKTVIDREIAAQDLRGGDLDGDGTPDVVGVGGSTHNVVWYRFKRK
jgi:FG-GAP-like repeat